jgi:hypothetical protein
MRKELPKLPPFAVVTEEIAHASAVERFDQQLVELSGHVGATRYVLAKRGQEDSFHRRPEPQQVGVPFPIRLDPGPTLVVQLVAQLQGQLEIVAQRVGVSGFGQREDVAPGVVFERLEDGFRDWTPTGR